MVLARLQYLVFRLSDNTEKGVHQESFAIGLHLPSKCY